jgi:3-hydroxyisobutyrate dehydrogenase-like beta-hydroxyacid dehydrogenase
MNTVGFLGLGSMGGAMARRLISAGHSVVVWNRSVKAVDELVAIGALRAHSPAEALSADLSFSMFANDEAVQAVFDENALAAASGRIHVLMASISPSMADTMSERFAGAGVDYVGAPVLGRPEVAAAGQLDILAAGPAAAIEAVEPYLAVLGKRIWRFGERPSIANIVKASVNYNIIHALQALGESVAMTERQGVPPELFTDLLRSTLFGGVVYNVYGDLIARGAYSPPGFTVALGRKDLGLAQEVAAASGLRLATLPALAAVFDQALADPGLRDKDWSAIAEVSRRNLL